MTDQAVTSSSTPASIPPPTPNQPPQAQTLAFVHDPPPSSEFPPSSGGPWGASAQVRPASGCGCGGSGAAECTCGGDGPQPCTCSETTNYVYAIGTVTARFPTLNIEKEFMQAWGKAPADTLTIRDSDKFEVLSQGQNLYLAREMCWVFQSGDIDIYILRPRSYVELTDLVSCLSPTPGLISSALIVGRLGPIAPPSMCNGIQLPVVSCDQVFSFTTQAFINNIVSAVTSGGSTVPGDVTAAAQNAFSVMTLLADNAGQTDEHRAINYLTFKSLALYRKEIEMEASGFRLNSVMARPDPLSRTRSVQDVILTYANNTTTETRRFFTRVDVTGEFPFLLNELAIFYDHP
jgi:hypothetical protein